MALRVGLAPVVAPAGHGAGRSVQEVPVALSTATSFRAPALRADFLAPAPSQARQCQPQSRPVHSDHRLVLITAAAAAGSAGFASACRFSASRRRRTRRARGTTPQQRQGRSVALQAGGAFDVNAWRAGFCDAEEPPEGYYILEGIADIPEDLRGTYYRSGPGRFSVAGKKIRHQLDGDGLMLGISFNGSGQVVVRQRLVQTQGLLRDDLTKRIVADGAHGTKRADTGNFIANMKKYEAKNTANAGALWYGDKLMALWPYGKPYMLDGGSLGTILGSEDSGATDLGGQLEKEVGFEARPRVCATTGALVNFAQTPSAMSTVVSLMEFPAGEWRPRYRFPKRLTVGGYTSFADMAVTPTFFVLAKPPVRADAIAAAFGGKTVAEILEYDAGASGELIFSTRNRGGASPGRGGGQDFNVPVDNLVCTEFANAYDAEGRVVLDVVAADRWVGPGRAPDGDAPLWEVEDPSTRPRTRLVRYDVNPKTQEWSKRVISEDLHVGFTTVNPKVVGKQHRFVFCAIGHATGVAGPMAGVAKVDVETGEVDSWVPGPTEFGGEPLFVPRSGPGDDSEEDDGYLITVLLDGAAGRSDVLIFDAKSVSKGPVSRFPLENGMLPHGLRGCWAEGVTFSPEEIQRKFVLLRMFQKKSKTWNAIDAGFNTLAGGAFFQKQGTAMR